MIILRSIGRTLTRIRLLSPKKRRRDNFEAKAHKHLEGVAEWVTPVAGMFLWLKLRLPPSNASDSSSSAPADEGDSFELISTKAKAAGVLAVPGMAFMPSGGKTCYVRTSFSIIPEEEVDEAFRRLRKVVLGAWEEAGRPLALEQ